MISTTDVTVYIGRFSPFHEGHASVLKAALCNSKLVIVLVGSSGLARSLKNPFTFEERKKMIEAWHSSLSFDYMGNLMIVPIKDHPYNDTLWIRHVQQTVKHTIANFASDNSVILNTISITGSDRDESTWYLQAFRQWKQEFAPCFTLEDNKNVSATMVREWMFSNEHNREVKMALAPSTLEFIAKFKQTAEFIALQQEYEFIRKYKERWSVAPYPVTFVTVDAIVVQSGHLLVVKRGHQPGKGLWALPGGFLNQNEKLKDGAIRELVEETGLCLAQGKNAKELTRAILRGSIREHETFDHPNRSARGRTITTAFLFRLDDTKPLPSVKAHGDPSTPHEILETRWITIDEALTNTEMWMEDHHAIVECMVGGKEL